MFKCSRCEVTKSRDKFHEVTDKNRNRPVTSWCADCRKTADRSRELFNFAFKKYGQICIYCKYPKKNTYRGVCKKCMKKQGLKECKRCKTILLLAFDFWEKKGACKHCLREQWREEAILKGVGALSRGEQLSQDRS